MNFYYYRYKFLIFYVIFGVFSIGLELTTLTFLIYLSFNEFVSYFISFLIGLLSAFFLNIKFNFQISRPKRFRALIYFAIISCFSLVIQTGFREYLIDFEMNMYESRFLVSGSLFFISYLLHRKFTFKDYKKVGVAIYAHGVEDIDSIYEKIGDVCNFIHVDIVDKSFNPNSIEVKAYKAEVIKAYWRNKFIEVHIMSINPIKWINQVKDYVNLIYVHLNSHNIINSIKVISRNNCEPGIVVTPNDDLNLLEEYIESIRYIMVLAIPKPGFSGQEFDKRSIDIINKLNKHKYRNNFNLCVDGGVNRKTIKLLDVDSVVSGSYVLKGDNPVKNIMLLQTSADYEKS